MVIQRHGPSSLLAAGPSSRQWPARDGAKLIGGLSGRGRKSRARVREADAGAFGRLFSSNPDRPPAFTTVGCYPHDRDVLEQTQHHYSDYPSFDAHQRWVGSK